MSKTPNYDAKVKAILDGLKPGDEQICPLSGKKWFLDEKEIEVCRKFNVTPSKTEPETRLNYLNGFNTGFSLWWKKDVHGETIISTVHPDSPIFVMKDSEWDTNEFDDIGFEYDAEQSFWDQMWDLRLRAPEKATRSTGGENTIGIASYNSVDSYMACASMVNRCLYTYAMVVAEDSIDISNGEKVIRSYRVNGSQNIVDSEYVFESVNCLNSSFLFDCWNCEFCFGATNKRNKKYLWFNKQLSEEEWHRKREQVYLACSSESKKYEDMFHDLMVQNAVWPQTFSFGNEQSTGERVLKCVRCEDCYWMIKSVDVYRSRMGLENENCAYVSGPGWAKEAYLSTGTSRSAKIKFCMAGEKIINCEYCAFCVECENCFGCISLKRKKFCIFNKQYSEEEYWKKIDQIKCQMLDEGAYGEFWPVKFCPFGLEYSVGEIYFGYSEDELIKWGAERFDPNQGLVLAPKQLDQKAIGVDDIPDCLSEMDSAKYVGVPIYDKTLKRNFSVTQTEFDMYQKKHWPFPRHHFINRLTNLIRHSNSPLKEQVDCGECKNKITTYKNFTFKKRKVLCRECYLKYLEQYG